jgi:hypothetical protein
MIFLRLVNESADFYLYSNGNIVFRFTNFHLTNSFNGMNSLRKLRDTCMLLVV